MDYALIVGILGGCVVGGLIVWVLKSSPDSFKNVDWDLVRTMTAEFVNAAEQIFAKGDNQQKLDYVTARVLELLDERGWTGQLSEDMVRSLVEAAVGYMKQWK